jgi:ribonuclease D
MRHQRRLRGNKVLKIDIETIKLDRPEAGPALILPFNTPLDRTSITQEEVNALPLGAFEGKVSVITDRKELYSAFNAIEAHPLVGFDTETKPAFVKGQRHKVALMQISLPSEVFLVRIKQTGLTQELITFLENKDITKAGVGIRDDIKALQHLAHFTPNGFVELAELSRQTGLEVESVKKLTALLLGFRISKSAQTSNWEAEQLDSRQISYAATDAWVCLQIYEVLSKLKKGGTGKQQGSQGNTAL